MEGVKDIDHELHSKTQNCRTDQAISAHRGRGEVRDGGGAAFGGGP